MNIKLSLLLTLLLIEQALLAQINPDQLSLAISKADEDNQKKLKEYVWKRRSDVFIESQLKLTTITEFSFTPEGKLETNIVDAETTVKKKPGLRGAVLANAADDKLDYIERALMLSLNYTFMTMGEMLDFFNKAIITEKNGELEAVAHDVHVPGDRLLICIDPKQSFYP